VSAAQPAPQRQEDASDPNNCATCEHKQRPDGGWCYMFREQPEPQCMQHRARRAAAPSPQAQAQPLIPISPTAREGKPPCGECHLQPGERCDICGAQAQAQRLPCGHPAELMLASAETGEPLYCELCDDKSGRRDAEHRESELQAENAELRRQLAEARKL
jgi:hypothetical protein